MGRAMLIAVVLISTLYAGIVINVQRQMLKIPSVLVENFLKKDAENLSDYALRTAVRDASAMGLTPPETGVLQFSRRYKNFRIGRCTIDSIQYRFITDRAHFQAKTFISGKMQGIPINYPAEITFNFPSTFLVPTPDGIYYQCDQPQFHGSNEYVRDDSGNNNTGVPMGGMGTRPKGYGVEGWKCAYFDGVDDYINCPDNESIRIDSTFTYSVFFKIEDSEDTACLFWAASNPFDTGTPSGGNPGFNLRYKPCAAIWYTKNPNQLHYAVTLKYIYAVLQIDISYTPVGQWPHNKDPWHHAALVFNKGTLKAYLNGNEVGSTSSILIKKTVLNTYGVHFGRRDIRVPGTPTADLYYLQGELDQMALFRRALSASEIYNLYWGIIKPASLLYIRD